MSLVSIGLKSTEKKLQIYLILFFFHIINYKNSCEILPKHNASSFISEF